MRKGGEPIPAEVFDEAMCELARLNAGHVPSDSDLAAAPLLTDYIVESCGHLYRLYGVVKDHPVLDDGWCTTSPLIAVGPHQAWCRTVSRYYRLGRPLLERIHA